MFKINNFVLFQSAMNDLGQSQHLIEGLINIIENQIRLENGIQAHHLVLLVPLDIVVINHPPITSMLNINLL